MRPWPKSKRKVNYAEIEYVRQRDGFCIAGLKLKDGCMGAMHVHHIKTRGSGGDDVRSNLICLCAKHHDQAHRGFITKKELFDWLEERYGSQ